MDDSFEAFPSILAMPLRSLETADHPRVGLWDACDVVEISLRFVVSAGLAAIREGESSPEVSEVLRRNLEEPTLGKWHKMANTVVGVLDSGTAATALREFLHDTLEPFFGSRESPETSILTLRNWLAHGSGSNQTPARDLFESWRPRILDAYRSSSWLARVRLVVQLDNGALGQLRGPHPEPQSYEPGDDPAAQRVRSRFEHRDQVLLVDGNESFLLWPLASFGRPAFGESIVGTEPVAQVYVRRHNRTLHLTPFGSSSVVQSESTSQAFEAFLGFVRGQPEAPHSYAVQGFEEECRRDAGKLVGRESDVTRVCQLLDAREGGIHWLEGAAGIGKSFLVAAVVTRLLDSKLHDSTVLPYRFKSGDPRCSRDQFMQWAAERLASVAGRALRGSPADVVRQALGAVGNRRIIFVVDGLDEIDEIDRKFAEEIVLRLARPGVTWLCAGRPGRVSAAFCNVPRVFELGLAKMSADDIRAMVMTRIGRRAREVLYGDDESRVALLNPFIDLLVARAAGLPIYVRHAIHDILSGRLPTLDSTAPLPADLERYHADLLARLGVGNAPILATSVVALLACAREPLSIGHFVETLVSRYVLPSRGKNNDVLVRRACAQVASLLEQLPVGHDEPRFRLYHHSIRRQLIEGGESAATVAAMEEWLVARCAGEVSAGNAFDEYVRRHGIAHLTKAKRIREALTLFDSITRGRVDTPAQRATVIASANLLAVELDPDDRDTSRGLDALALGRMLTWCTGFDRLHSGLTMLRRYHRGRWNKILGMLLAREEWIITYALSLVLADGASGAERSDAYREIRALERSPDMARRELAIYAWKLIWTRDPACIDAARLEALTRDPSPVIRGVVGEAVLNLAVVGAGGRNRVSGAQFWRPKWPYHRTQVADILAAEAFLDRQSNVDLDAEAAETLVAMHEIESKRVQLEGRLPLDTNPAVRKLVVDFYALVCRPHEIRLAAAALEACEHRLDVAEVLFAHPAWEIREAAASVMATVAETHSNVIGWARGRMSDPDYRVRYSVLNFAGFLQHVDGGELFREAIACGYRDSHAWIRGLTASWLTDWRSSDDRGIVIREFQKIAASLLGDHDQWCLQEMWILFQDAPTDQEPFRSLLAGPVSPILAGLPSWHTRSHEAFETHLEQWAQSSHPPA